MISKEDIKKITEYVDIGLQLPVTEESIQKIIWKENINVSIDGLSMKDTLALFIKVRHSAYSWERVNSSILSLLEKMLDKGEHIKVYGDNVVKTIEGISEYNDFLEVHGITEQNTAADIYEKKQLNRFGILN